MGNDASSAEFCAEIIFCWKDVTDYITFCILQFLTYKLWLKVVSVLLQINLSAPSILCREIFLNMTVYKTREKVWLGSRRLLKCSGKIPQILYKKNVELTAWGMNIVTQVKNWEECWFWTKTAAITRFVMWIRSECLGLIVLCVKKRPKLASLYCCIFIYFQTSLPPTKV